MNLNQPPMLRLYMIDELMAILNEIDARLAQNMRTLAVAEDGCTCGLLATTLATACDSTTLRRAWLVQDQASKVEEVAVQRATIEQYAEASEAVAIEMAHGARRNAACTYGIATCGRIDDKPRKGPVGLVWIAISHGTTFSLNHHELQGSRHEMAVTSVLSAIWLLQEAIRYF